MNITNVKIHKLDGSTKTEALANITLDNAIVITGLKVMNGQNGLWVAMPNRKDKNNEYHDIVFPITKEARQEIQDTVLAKFQEVDQSEAQREAQQVYEAHQEKKEYEEDDSSLPF